uniref:Cytochrome b561 domain-containing protein n=1 Tax=Caenorhabditis tropicalis TaxID=1561998 RepID=A0A1I7TF41_9PELO
MMEPSANPVAALDRPPTVPPPKPHRRLLNYLRTSQWFKTHLTYLVVFPFNILFGIDNSLQYDQFHIFHTVPGLIISLLLINSLPRFFRPSVQKRRHIIGGLVVSIISVSAILIGVTRPPGHDAANWFSLGTIGLSAGYFAFSRFYKWFYLVVDPMETMGRIVFSVAICIGHLGALSIMVLYDLSWVSFLAKNCYIRLS